MIRLHSSGRAQVVACSTFLTFMVLPPMAGADGVIGLPIVEVDGAGRGSRGGGGGGGGSEPGALGSSAAETNEMPTDVAARRIPSDGCALTTKGPDGKDIKVTLNSPTEVRRAAANAVYNNLRQSMNPMAFNASFGRSGSFLVVTYSDGSRERWIVLNPNSSQPLDPAPVFAQEPPAGGAQDSVARCGPAVAAVPNP